MHGRDHRPVAPVQNANKRNKNADDDDAILKDRVHAWPHDGAFDKNRDVFLVELLPHHDEQAGQHKADIEEQVGVRFGGAQIAERLFPPLGVLLVGRGHDNAEEEQERQGQQHRPLVDEQETPHDIEDNHRADGADDGAGDAIEQS